MNHPRNDRPGTPQRRTVVMDDRARPLGAYPHAHIANGLVFVSGTSSRRPDDTVAGAETGPDGTPVFDIRAQTEAVIANIERILHEAGAGLEDIVSFTTFLVSMEDFAGYNEVYRRFFDARTGPARTTVAVKELPGPLLRIEMQAIATLPAEED